MNPLKQKALEIVDRLPEDASWSDLVYEIQVRQKIEEGLRDRRRPSVSPRRGPRAILPRVRIT